MGTDFSLAHFILEFLNTILALVVAGAGFYHFIDARFKTVFGAIDKNKKIVESEYVRTEIHKLEIEHLKELSAAEMKSLIEIFQTELRFVNQKLDTLIKHDEMRNGIK